MRAWNGFSSLLRTAALGWLLILAAHPLAGAKQRTAHCARVQQAVHADRWYFMIVRSDERGTHEEVQIPFASETSFAESLQGCAALGLLDLDSPVTVQGIPTLYKSFSYVPAIGSRDVAERQVRLKLPEYTGLSGSLAIRVEMSREGEVLAKDLLFSTDEKLGQLVMDDLEQGLQITRTGIGPGPFIDVMSLEFQNGILVALIESHHFRLKE